MKLSLVRAILPCLVCLIGRAEEDLITAAGKFGRDEGRITLEVNLPDPDHLVWTLVFKSDYVHPVTGKTWNRSRSVRADVPLPVAREKWAFCFGVEGQVWLYDGNGTILRYQDSAAGMKTVGKCADPEIEKQAPAALQSWIKKKEPSVPADARGQCVGPRDCDRL